MELINNLNVEGAMAASAALIFLGDAKIGRKLELLLASGLFAIGTVVQSFSPTLDLVLVGRIIYGLGIGSLKGSFVSFVP